jgi:hypothetical protein
MKTQYYRCTATGLIMRSEHPQAQAEKLPATEGAKLLREQELDTLHRLLKPGQTVYPILRHVSASGMQRRISLRTVHYGVLVALDYPASVVTGRKLHAKGGLVCHGVGMDMGFDLVESLSNATGLNLRHEWV